MQHNEKKPILILVCGGSGSGKSTIANGLISEMDKKFSVKVIRQDNFYKSNPELQLEQREMKNYDHPDAFDWDLMNDKLIKLLNAEIVEIPIYDYKLHLRSDDIEVIGPHDIIILEGIYTLFDENINNLASLKIFIDTPADERLIRRIKRDTEFRGRSVNSIINQWKKTVRPMYKNFIENQKRKADLIIPWYKLNKIALKAIKNAIAGLSEC